MDKMFCDNPECQCHAKVPFNLREMAIWRGDDTRMHVTQHEYESRDGKTIIHLCSICHAAVELVRKGAQK